MGEFIPLLAIFSTLLYSRSITDHPSPSLLVMDLSKVTLEANDRPTTDDRLAASFGNAFLLYTQSYTQAGRAGEQVGRMVAFLCIPLLLLLFPWPFLVCSTTCYLPVRPPPPG
jgi:hypothetical protein